VPANVDRRGYPDAVFDANDQLRGDRLKHVDSIFGNRERTGGNNDPLIDGSRSLRLILRQCLNQRVGQ
jgi:hypothetical protein